VKLALELHKIDKIWSVMYEIFPVILKGYQVVNSKFGRRTGMINVHLPEYLSLFFI
jgi:hypothetical protein